MVRGRCRICRKKKPLTRHHLKPAMDGDPRHGKKMMLCKRCHRAAHTRYTNEELAVHYNTPGLLREALSDLSPESP